MSVSPKTSAHQLYQHIHSFIHSIRSGREFILSLHIPSFKPNSVFLHFIKMLAKVFTTFAATIVVVNAACFGSGEQWEDNAVAIDNAHKACFGSIGDDGAEVKGAFQDIFFEPAAAAPLPASTCVNNDGQMHNFQIFNLQDVGRTMTPEECFQGLQREIVGCPHGGDSSTDQARFV
jgi:hypothetical protein